jgi:hypothetical protein
MIIISHTLFENKKHFTNLKYFEITGNMCCFYCQGCLFGVVDGKWFTLKTVKAQTVGDPLPSAPT